MRSDQYSACDRKQSKFHRHLITTGNIDFSTGSARKTELVLDSVDFKINRYSQPDDRTYLFLNCLVEFGCENLLPHYLLNDFKEKKGTYRICCLGWHGRSCLYRELVDEFWELNPKYNYLRNYTRAFTPLSKNLKNIEKSLKKFGFVYGSGEIGNYFLVGECFDCKSRFHSDKNECPKCASKNIKPSMLGDYKNTKNKYHELKMDLSEHKYWANSLVKNKTIGIFARNRTLYGRNLTEDFYKYLITLIRNKGYDVIWLGEKASTLPCPTNEIYDFTTSQYADDLSRCLALVQRCDMTFQAWTASTRLSQLTNTPYCLVESPDQIYGRGQEGKRMYLLTKDFAKKKLLLCDYVECKMQELNLAKFCADNMFDFLENKNSKDTIGFVSNYNYVNNIMKENDLW